MAWGDSLTSGNEDGSGISWPGVLQTYTSQKVYNEGVGGQTSTQIAVRQGGVPTTVTVDGGSIPASGPVTLTFLTGHEPVTGQNSYEGFPGTIDNVPGSVTLNTATNVYTFTRSTAGSAVTVSANTPFIPSPVNATINAGITIIWASENNITQVAQVESDIAAMVATLEQPKRFLILSLPGENNVYYWTGASAYTQYLEPLNSYLAATYPNNYLDIRSLLVNDYNPADAQDVIDYSHGTTPSSLRAQDMSGTLVENIDESTCDIQVNSSIQPWATMTIGSELIYVTGTASSTQVNSCVRGYAGTTAVAHVSVASWTGIDPLHLGAKGYTFVAQQIWKWLQQNYQTS